MPHRPTTSFSGIPFVAGVLLVLAFASALAQGPAPPGNEPPSSDNFAKEDGVRSGQDAKLLAFFSTTTLTSIATTTQLKLSTCWSTGAASCAGRRKRRIFFAPKDSIVSELEVGVQLDGSTTSGLAVDDQPIDDPSNRTGRKLTVWSTGYTTVTLTSTSYYQGTTVTVTALCTVAGMGQSCFG